MNYLILIITVLLASCAKYPAQKHTHVAAVEVLKTVAYDGMTDDLLTAGLGLAGLRGPAPEISDQVTAKELRRASYYHQFKALNDLSVNGGMGTVYGFKPNQAAIAGKEYWSQRSVAAHAYHTLVLQIPEAFDASRACLVVAPSSGSRNVFGAVGTSGAWALTKGCAVVYTDKGTGTQVALSDGQTYLIDGRLSATKSPMNEATELSATDGLHVVQKHAYSHANPEQLWGHFVVDAADYGLALLKQEKQLDRAAVKVIAASVSNGGGAVLRAAEIDPEQLIDAVVAAEPQVNLSHQYDLLTAAGATKIKTRTLLELSIHMSLYEPCAALDKSLSTAPFKLNTVLLQAAMQARCAALFQHGLLNSRDLAGQTRESIQRITDLDIDSAALALSQVNTLANMWAAINHSYANSYLKKSAADNLCQSAMSAFTPSGEPRPLSQAELSAMFALSNGIAPGNGIEVAYTDTDNNIQSRMAAAPALGLSSQLCFYQLLSQPTLQQALGRLIAQPQNNQLPTIILHGQADGTVAINHSSRAYYHQNQSSEQANQSMRYYEIEQAQHFDAFLAYPGFDQQFVPMHPYFEQALDLMYHHLFDGELLPSSQVVKTKTRRMVSGKLTPLSRVHVPKINMQTKHAIRVNNNYLEVQ